MSRQLTAIRTDDGRILVTDSDNIVGVLKEAIENGVEFDWCPNTSDDELMEFVEDPSYCVEETIGSYLLLGHRFVRG